MADQRIFIGTGNTHAGQYIRQTVNVRSNVRGGGCCYHGGGVLLLSTASSTASTTATRCTGEASGVGESGVAGCGSGRSSAGAAAGAETICVGTC